MFHVIYVCVRDSIVDMFILTFLSSQWFFVMRNRDSMAHKRASTVRVIMGVSGESDRLTYNAPSPETMHAANCSHPIAVAANRVGNSHV